MKLPPAPSAAICVALLVTQLLSAAALAQDQQETSPELNSAMPRCGPAMDGQVFCKFGTIYECELVSPAAMERRTGWRWKADLLRSCAEPRRSGNEDRNVLPPGFTYAPQQNQTYAPQQQNPAGPSEPAYRPPRGYTQPR
jgi:hypothetical protein